jgi:hypothetical protein
VFLASIVPFAFLAVEAFMRKESREMPDKAAA